MHTLQSWPSMCQLSCSHTADHRQKHRVAEPQGCCNRATLGPGTLRQLPWRHAAHPPSRLSLSQSSLPPPASSCRSRARSRAASRRASAAVSRPAAPCRCLSPAACIAPCLAQLPPFILLTRSKRRGALTALMACLHTVWLLLCVRPQSLAFSLRCTASCAAAMSDSAATRSCQAAASSAPEPSAFVSSCDRLVDMRARLLASCRGLGQCRCFVAFVAQRQAAEPACQRGTATRLICVHDATIGMDLGDPAVCVHALGLVWRIQPKALPAAQQDVKIVVKIMVQSAGRACAHAHSIGAASS